MEAALLAFCGTPFLAPRFKDLKSQRELDKSLLALSLRTIASSLLLITTMTTMCTASMLPLESASTRITPQDTRSMTCNSVLLLEAKTCAVLEANILGFGIQRREETRRVSTTTKDHLPPTLAALGMLETSASLEDPMVLSTCGLADLFKRQLNSTMKVSFAP